MTESSLTISPGLVVPEKKPAPASSDYWLSGGVLLAGLLLWEVVGRLAHWLFLPPFSAVLLAAWQLIITGRVLPDLWESLGSLFVGFGLAALIGVILGWLMGRYRNVEYLLDMQLNILLSSPTLIYIPVLFAFFGVSRDSQTALVFLYALPVIIANTLTGIRTVNAAQIELARSFGANERQLFWVVLLPAALPLIMVGLRTGIARAVKGMIDGEMVIALVGLGAALIRYGGRFEVDRLMAVLLIVILVSVALTQTMQFIEHRAARWLVKLS